MSDYLAPVVATFIAEAAQYTGPVGDMVTAAEKAEEATDLLRSAVGDLNEALRETGAAAATATGAWRGAAGASADLRDAAAGARFAVGAANWALRGTADAAGSAGRGLAAAGAEMSSVNRRAGNLAGKISGTLTPSLAALDAELDKKIAALGGLAAATTAVNMAMGRQAAATAVTAAAAGRGTRMFGLTANALHWIVMGTLEVAATAVPALVALGAAAAGMYPTFAGIYDQMSSLVIASGGLHGALLNSVGPLHQLGQSLGTLTQKMAPDAYVIFGSVINDLSGRMGTFSGVARQAGAVLASFATKITTDLQGPAGQMLAGFFANAVKYMIQWGQFLGNLGHTFLNVMNSMWGVGRVLLDVLVGISRVLLAITSNPVGAWFIGLASAMSAAYRYAILLRNIWVWLGGSALVNGIRGLIGAFGAVGAAEAATMEETIALGTALGTVAALATTVGIVLGAAAVAFAAYYAATHMAKDNTQSLIQSVESATPTFSNLTHGIGQLGAALSRQGTAFRQQTSLWNDFLNMFSGGGGLTAAVSDIGKLNAAIRHQVTELENLGYGLAQTRLRTGAVGAAMSAMAIQTALADSKIQQVNQALDQYMQLVTGGTGGVAAFEQSLANIGQVAGTAAGNLGTATGQMSLSAAQFARALSTYTGKGAGAWVNFDQVVGSTMPQLMDWFRQAAQLGATTGTSVQRAALDMVAAMVKWAGSNKTAQASLMAFARAQGISVRNWGGLLRAIRTQGAGQADLRKRIDGTTIALSNLSQMARNASAILSQQMSASIARAALKSTNFNRDITRAMQSLKTGMPVAGHMASYWFQHAGTDAVTAGQRAGQGAKAVQAAAQNITASARTEAQAFDKAKLHAEMFQRYVDTMHGNTIWVTAMFRTAGAGAAYAQGTSPVPSPGGAGGPHRSGVFHQTIVHVHGSVVTEQQLTRAVQGGVLRKTLRNNGTQLFLPGRLH